MQFSTPNEVLSFMLKLEGEMLRIRALEKVYHEYGWDADGFLNLYNRLECVGRQLGYYEAAKECGETADCSPLALEVLSNLYSISTEVNDYHFMKALEMERITELAERQMQRRDAKCKSLMLTA